MNNKNNNNAASNQYHHLIEAKPPLFWFPLSNDRVDGEVEVKGPAIFGDDESKAVDDADDEGDPPGVDESDPDGEEDGDPAGEDDGDGAGVPDGGAGVARAVGVADVVGLVVDAG